MKKISLVCRGSKSFRNTEKSQEHHHSDKQQLTIHISFNLFINNDNKSFKDHLKRIL
jgi:hypothetical protein